MNVKLPHLNVSYSSVTTLIAKNCAKLENLQCERCEITELNIEGCENIRNLDCAYNSLMRLDVSDAKKLENFACKGQRVRNIKLTQSFNFIEFLFRRISEFFAIADVENNSDELEYVSSLKAYDENGKEISASLDKNTGSGSGDSGCNSNLGFSAAFFAVLLKICSRNTRQKSRI